MGTLPVGSPVWTMKPFIFLKIKRLQFKAIFNVFRVPQFQKQWASRFIVPDGAKSRNASQIIYHFVLVKQHEA